MQDITINDHPIESFQTHIQNYITNNDIPNIDKLSLPFPFAPLPLFQEILMRTNLSLVSFPTLYPLHPHSQHPLLPTPPQYLPPQFTYQKEKVGTLIKASSWLDGPIKSSSPHHNKLMKIGIPLHTTYIWSHSQTIPHLLNKVVAITPRPFLLTAITPPLTYKQHSHAK